MNVEQPACTHIPVGCCISVLAISPSSLACASHHGGPWRALCPRGRSLGTLGAHLMGVGKGRVLGHWICQTKEQKKDITEY